MQPKRIEARIRKVKKEMSEIGEMRPGSLSKQYAACKKPGCRCVDPVKPKKHGPYYQLSYTHAGKSTTQFIRPPLVPMVRKQLANYKKFRALSEEWVKLSLDLSKVRLEEAKRAASKQPRTRYS